MILYKKKEQMHQELKQFTPSKGALAIAAVALKTPVKALEVILTNCWIIDSNYLAMLVNIQTPKYIGDQVILWDNKIVISKELRDWEYINFIYPLLVVNNKLEVIKRITSVNNAIKTDLQYYNIKLVQLRSEIIDKSEDIYRHTIEFFDSEEMIKSFKKLRVKVSLFEGRVVAEFNNIKLGNDEEGYLMYRKIFLFIKDWKINGYVYNFKNFDYSSYWDLDIRLHPYIVTPYGFNEVMTWMPKHDYNMYAKALVEMTTLYMADSGTNGGLHNIIKSFNQYRKLWNGLRYNYNNRTELSQAIFKGE